MVVKITMQCEVPEEDLETFLRSVRAFDLTYPGSDFHIVADGGSHTTDEVVSMLERVGIPLVFAAKPGGNDDAG